LKWLSLTAIILFDEYATSAELWKMNDLMSYKGFTARIEFSDDNVFVRRLIGIEDIVVFDGETVDELRKRFREAVDFHIEVCEKTDKK